MITEDEVARADEDEVARADDAKPLSRKKFMRRVGVTVAAALGIGALLPASAFATNNCCRNATLCTGPCDPNTTWYYCDCGTSSYCVCQDVNTPLCYQGPC